MDVTIPRIDFVDYLSQESSAQMTKKNKRTSIWGPSIRQNKRMFSDYSVFNLDKLVLIIHCFGKKKKLIRFIFLCNLGDQKMIIYSFLCKFDRICIFVQVLIFNDQLNVRSVFEKSVATK